jgi:hypothetical protein
LLSCGRDLKALDRALSAPLDLKATAVANLPDICEAEEAAAVAGASRSRCSSLGEVPQDAGVKVHLETGEMVRGSPSAENEPEALALQDEKDAAELEAADLTDWFDMDQEVIDRIERIKRELEVLKAAHAGRQRELQELHRRRASSLPDDWNISRSGPGSPTMSGHLEQQIWAANVGANELESLESVELESLCPICLETRPQAMHARICGQGTWECADTCCRGCLFSHVRMAVNEHRVAADQIRCPCCRRAAPNGPAQPTR